MASFSLPPTVPATPELMRALLPPAGGEKFPLWPAGTTPPGESAPAPERGEYWTVTGIAEPYPHGAHLNLFNVWQPEIEIFPAKRANAGDTTAAVLIAPGGCYQFLSWTLEGVELARWLNSFGVTAAVLKYRVPTRSGATPGEMELKDAQRALALLRANAAKWGIDPLRVGMLGFSAGAHLSALAGNAPARAYDAVDAADAQNVRPDFTVLMYPAYLAGEGALAPLTPTARTAPAIFIHAADDPFTVESSLQYFAALRAAGVSAEMHIYAAGGHGYGIRPTSYP
ncbi:MAG: alpha/beta hydrolase, partial [Puniceicoccales bacterium]|nr:alpha/beta hydrolase [Puniceicoccales bacterium]